MQYLESLGDVPVLHKQDEGESPVYESHCSKGEHIVTTSNVTHPSHLNTLLLSPSLTIYVPHPYLTPPSPPSLTPPSPLPHPSLTPPSPPCSHTPQSLLTHLLHPSLPLTCHILTSSTSFSPLPLHFTHPSYHTPLILTLHYLSPLSPNPPHTHPSHIPSRPSSHPEEGAMKQNMQCTPLPPEPAQRARTTHHANQ